MYRPRLGKQTLLGAMQGTLLNLALHGLKRIGEAEEVGGTFWRLTKARKNLRTIVRDLDKRFNLRDAYSRSRLDTLVRDFVPRLVNAWHEIGISEGVLEERLAEDT